MPEKYFDAVWVQKPHGIVCVPMDRECCLSLFPGTQSDKEQVPLVITSQLIRSAIDLHFRKQLQLEGWGSFRQDA